MSNILSIVNKPSESELSLVSQVSTCKSANEFYQQKKLERVVDTEHKLVNDEFWNKVRKREIPYERSKIPDWSKGSTSLWISKHQENPQYFDLDCQHGVNCKRVNGKKNCNCSFLVSDKGWKETFKARAKRRNSK